MAVLMSEIMAAHECIPTHFLPIITAFAPCRICMLITVHTFPRKLDPAYHCPCHVLADARASPRAEQNFAFEQVILEDGRGVHYRYNISRGGHGRDTEESL